MKLNLNMDAKMEEIKNMKLNENVTNTDNSKVVNTNTTSSPGGIVISNTANTTNDTVNDTINDTEVDNVQDNEQSAETGSGMTDMLIFGAVLVAVYMYSRKRRGL
jgi:hypothetical protein